MRGGQSFFQPRDVQHAAFNVCLVELQGASLRYARAVPEHQRQKATVAGLISAAFGGGNQLIDLGGNVAFSVVHVRLPFRRAIRLVKNDYEVERKCSLQHPHRAFQGS